MAFKNALKNLVAHFGIVWSLLLYIVIFAAVIIGLSLPFLLPIHRAFETAGVYGYISGAFSDLLNSGNWQGLVDGISSGVSAVEHVLNTDSGLASILVVYLLSIAIVVFRFFLGLYEIPMATVLDGHMSCNARYGFAGKFFSTLSVSVRYSMTKMVYTVAFDVVIGFVVYGIRQATGFNIGLAVLACFVFICFGALRFSIVACWAPCVASGEYGILRGFVKSAQICFKRFGSIYSTYFVSLTLIMAIGVFLSIFTLGVGLVIVLPLSACYTSYLNVTEYYNKTGKRYYVDEAVFTPPIENTL